jgi:hypothetical protein
MSLSVLSLNQLKAIGCSDGLAPISRPGYSRLADSKEFRYGHGRHAKAADGPMAYKASIPEGEVVFSFENPFNGMKRAMCVFA